MKGRALIGLGLGVAVALLAAMPAAADEALATVKEVVGRVELKAPDGVWTLAAVGTALNKDTLVSTGFNSQVVLALGASSLTIKPLTRLSLEEIARREGDETVSLYLLAGRVRAEVHPPAGGRTEFRVKSTTATASVRGTAFDFDAVNLDVSDGVVSFSGTSGGPGVEVSRGETSYIDENGSASPPQLAEAAAASPPPIPAGVDPAFFDAAKPGSEVKNPLAEAGTVDVIVGW